MPITPLDDPRSPNPGKAPIGRGWGARRLSTRALFAIFRRHPRAGVGVILGPAAGVVDLEIDDRQQARPLLTELFPGGTPVTMGWESSRGEHRLFRWDDRLGRARSAVVVITYQRLEEYLRAFAQGHFHLVILVGAGGVGKSRSVRSVLDGKGCWIEGTADRKSTRLNSSH